MEQAADGLPGIDKGLPKVAPEHIEHLGGIALHHGPVQAISGVQRLLRLHRQPVRALGQGIARDSLQQKKGGRCNDEKGQDHLKETADDVFDHINAPVLAYAAICIGREEPAKALPPCIYVL